MGLTQACNSRPCETFAVVVGAWSQCDATCGGGVRTRNFGCVSSLGYSAAAVKCTEAMKANSLPSFENCNLQSCAAYIFVYRCGVACSASACTPLSPRKRLHCTDARLTCSAFGPCSASCGSGVRTRVVKCVDSASGAETDSAQCDALGDQLELSQTCNTQPCTSYMWSVGAWEPCSAACGGIKHRQLACVDAATGTAAAALLCSALSPVTQSSCEPCPFCADLSQNKGCSGNGACTDGKCVCNAGYGGSICAIASLSCASGVLDASKACCQSGVLDNDRACCAASGTANPILDKYGKCCSGGAIDACGVCGGKGKGLDATGVCCEVRSESALATGGAPFRRAFLTPVDARRALSHPA